MAYSEQFTPEEWQQLLDTPALVGAAVMVCSGSGLGTMKEAFALTRGLLDIPPSFAANGLVQAVVEARQQGEASATSWQDGYQQMELDEFLRSVLDQCKALTALLATPTRAADADGFKRWVLGIGERVASAAREGGFLGIGGERISLEEEQLLRDIARALQVEAP